MDTVEVTIGPASSALAADWCAATRTLVVATRERGASIGVRANQHALDLCEVVVDAWAARATQAPAFNWTYDCPVDVLLRVSDGWLTIGEMTDEQVLAIGASWAPPHTRPFADAVRLGATSALLQVGPRAEPLLARARAAAGQPA